MNKRLILILAFALMAAVCIMPAYAAVQNVKVSGDILIQAIDRNDFGLAKHNSVDFGGTPLDVYKNRAGIITAARLRVDADLTDNVTATIRLLNERSWGTDKDWMDSASEPILLMPNLTTIDEKDSVAIDLAYVTLKEFLYSPLTLTIGRQELRFGNAFIIGDPDTRLAAAELAVPWDLSVRKSFDAIRATLNYDPMVLDIVYAKIHENDVLPWWYGGGGFGPIGTAPEHTDTDLYGINATYDLNSLGFKGNAQGYFWVKNNKEPIWDILNLSSSITKKQDTCYTVGGLVSGELMKDSTGVLTGSIEGAYQFGHIQYTPLLAGVGNPVNGDMRQERSAWALQGGVNYAINMKMKPNVGLSYTFVSGDKNDTYGSTGSLSQNKKWGFWDPMFNDQVPNNITAALFPLTNCHIINVRGSLKPMDDVTLSAVYGWYRLADTLEAWGNFAPSPYGPATAGLYSAYAMEGNKHFLGNAVDATLTYDYTEDVQFGLTGGLFMPGKAFDSGNRQTASQVIGSMKVTF